MQLKFEMVLQDYCRKKKIMHSCSRELVTNIFALQSVCWNPCREVWVGGLSMRPGQVIVLCPFSSILQNREKHQFGDSYLIQHKIL